MSKRNERVNKAQERALESFHLWELADGDSDGTPCRYKPGIMVNFYGTFITAGELPVDDPEWTEGYINSDDEWGYYDDRRLTLEEVAECENAALRLTGIQILSLSIALAMCSIREP